MMLKFTLLVIMLGVSRSVPTKQITNISLKLCLEESGLGAAFLTECKDSSVQQKWTFSKPKDGLITNEKTKHCLFAKMSGTITTDDKCDANAISDQFTFNRSNQTILHFAVGRSGRCLTTTSFRNVINGLKTYHLKVAKCNGEAKQQFYYI